MIFQHRYAGGSAIAQRDGATAMSFAPDTLRPPTLFRGRVTRELAFREAISALHAVVTADLRFVAKDRTAYHAWRAQQGYADTAQLVGEQKRVSDEITALHGELRVLESRASTRRQAFFAARQRYFRYLYERDRDLWIKLDPVITVHPDQVFFECFSRDESSYGRLAASYEAFDALGERVHGTTNIDYSERLYGEFQKIRSYKTTSLEIDPSGFDVTTSLEERYREVKIDLPDSWVRGFLQVSSAQTLPAHVLELHPMEVHNLCLVLRRNKELVGPRSLKFQLTPGGPVAVTVEPWGTVVACPRSRYVDSPPAGAASEIRIWGRRRLMILERLLPHARRVRVFLLGSGLPSYWVVDLGDLSFTLGLSGWTLNNWSEAGNFDLMAAREDVDSDTQQRVFDALGETWLATPGELAAKTGLDAPIVASALVGWVQAGRAIYDLERGVYRKRELTRDPLPVEQLRFANDREAAAAVLVQRAKIAIDRADVIDGGLVLAGRLRDRGRVVAAGLTFDRERRIVAGDCTCDYFVRHRLHRGPCEHMLALRAAHRRGVNDAIAFDPAPASTQRGPLRSVPSAAEVARAQADAAHARSSFAAAIYRGVSRAVEMRAAGRAGDAIAELERVARLAPPSSEEHARILAVIAEARLEAGDHQAAAATADLVLMRLPTSALALRIKRDALAALDELPRAIPVARALVDADDTAAHWVALIGLCERAADWGAMLHFAEEGLRRHPREPALVRARDAAAQQLTPAQAASARSAATSTPAPAKPSWWRRALDKLRRAPADPADLAARVEHRLPALVDELAGAARVIDRAGLLQTLRLAHLPAEGLAAKHTALLAALKVSPAIADLPADQALMALLRRTLS